MSSAPLDALELTHNFASPGDVIQGEVALLVRRKQAISSTHNDTSENCPPPLKQGHPLARLLVATDVARGGAVAVQRQVAAKRPSLSFDDGRTAMPAQSTERRQTVTVNLRMLSGFWLPTECFACTLLNWDNFRRIGCGVRCMKCAGCEISSERSCH
jgi:hypothetical protein